MWSGCFSSEKLLRIIKFCVGTISIPSADQCPKYYESGNLVMALGSGRQRVKRRYDVAGGRGVLERDLG